MSRAFFATMVLLGIYFGSVRAGRPIPPGSKGHLKFFDEAGDNKVERKHYVFDDCKVLDVEGVITDTYQIKFNPNPLPTAVSGCALLFKGEAGNLGSCDGSPTYSIKMGDSVTLHPEQGEDYLGVKYAATC